MKRTIILMVVLLLSIGLIWAGAGKEEPAAETAKEGKYGGILRKVFFAPTSLDPAFTASITDDEIARFWGDFLVYVDEGLRPDQSRSLAEKWEVSADGVTWTFPLRKGVKFHNGEELSS